MHRPLSAACLGALLSLSLPGQMFVGGAPAGAMPLVEPLAPPFGQSSPAPSSPTRTSPARTSPAPGAPCMPAEARDPTTQGTQLEGKQLARAIASVTALPWFEDLDEARLESAASGKPVLWLQALGEIDGFA